MTVKLLDGGGECCDNGDVTATQHSDYPGSRAVVAGLLAIEAAS